MVGMDKLGDKKEKMESEETVSNTTEKKTNQKIKIQERILARKQERNEKRISSHINLADVKIDEAIDDAELEIAVLLEEVDLAIEEDEKSVELIIYNAGNYMEEILLTAQLKIQKTKNKLIRNLEGDLEDTINVDFLEETISGFKEKSAVVTVALREKIDTENKVLKEKYGK